jgi:N-acetylmuramoyl-L-alanine amidase
MRQINKLIVHCSATREGHNIPVETIRKWHMEGRGWSDIGYHFYIDLEGNISKGRDITKMGAHCKGHNRNSIGICYCGGVEADGKTPKDTRNFQQTEALLCVLRTLKAMYPKAKIHSHNDFANKACPSFDATCEYEDINNNKL